MEKRTWRLPPGVAVTVLAFAAAICTLIPNQRFCVKVLLFLVFISLAVVEIRLIYRDSRERNIERFENEALRLSQEILEFVQNRAEQIPNESGLTGQIGKWVNHEKQTMEFYRTRFSARVSTVVNEFVNHKLIDTHITPPTYTKDITEIGKMIASLSEKLWHKN